MEEKVIVTKSKLTAIGDNIRNQTKTTKQYTLDEMAKMKLGGSDTSDATATSEDILLGKTAYVNDVKVVGTIEDYDGEVEGEAVEVVPNLVKAILNRNPDYFNYMFAGSSYLDSDFKEMYDKGETLVIGKPEFAEKLLSSSEVAKYETLFSETPAGDTTSRRPTVGYLFKDTKVNFLPKIELYVPTHGTIYSAEPFFAFKGLDTDILEVEVKAAVDNSGRVTFLNVADMFGSATCKEITITFPNGCYNQRGMFYNCSKLETLIINYRNRNSAYRDAEGIELTSGTYGQMFYGCKNLKNIKFNTITDSNVQLGSGTSYGHLLTLESLLSAIQACYRKSSRTYTLTVGSANIEKLANVYVKVVDETDTNYYPFEQCESTDEGAMTISDYLALKNWTIA